MSYYYLSGSTSGTLLNDEVIPSNHPSSEAAADVSAAFRKPPRVLLPVAARGRLLRLLRLRPEVRRGEVCGKLPRRPRLLRLRGDSMVSPHH
jgi:hypothetical protein